jgi:hypothetical protein
MSLAGKTALVTGAAKRLGRATALTLAHEGVNVVLHCRTSTKAAEELADAGRALGVKAWTLTADLASPGAAQSLVERALDMAGPLDFLINNASVFPTSAMADVSVENVHASVDLNALAPFLAARRFAEQRRDGAIINFLDARIVDYDREHVAYHLSKRMLFELTRMMALEFAPAIRVNAVAPGLILPPAGKDESYLASLAHTNPLNRYGGVDDVTSAVVFLLQSPFITGQVIFVDGGRHLRGNMYGC